ncbi:MAG TPA: translocation/assembly module TamB domain-containing protein [Gemmatimonadaceae bacterium]
MSDAPDPTPARPTEDPNKLHWGRGALVGLIMVLSLVVIAAAALWIVTGTDWGRERVRRYAQNAVNGMIHGKATIGRLSGNLLTGMTVHDFAITDSAGKPFVAVESFTAKYNVMSLLRKHIWIEDPVIVRPLIVLDRPQDGAWNWARIFARDTTPKAPSQQTSWGDWLRFTNAEVVGGQLIVRTPWKPSEALKTQAARDSAIRDVLGGGSRLMVTATNGGYQKTVQLDSVNATIPLLRLSEPGQKNRLLEVSSLKMKAFPFRPPAADIRDLKGIFPFNNDSIWWQNSYVALAQSKASGDGSYVFSSGDMNIHLRSDPASFADMRWIYPRLPDGGGKVELKMTWRGALQDYTLTNTALTIGAAKIDGGFGITLGDTLTIHDTNLRFAGVDTRLIEQLLPGFKSPRRGVLSGRSTASGGKHALALNSDITFDDRAAGRSRVTGVGVVGFLDNGGIRAANLKLGMMPLQVDMIRTWAPALPIAGVLTGTATLNGSTNTQLAAVFDVDHNDRGERSQLTGKGTISLAGAKRFDVDINTHPVSLAELGLFLPAAGLHNSASGPVRLTGTLADLKVNVDLRLPDGGRLQANGALDLASKDKGYDVTARMYTLNIRTITTKGPITSLSALAMAKGRGTDPATMRATFAADLATSRWDSIAVDSIALRASVANGIADVAKLYARGAHTDANVSGTFGLVKGTTGDLAYRLATDSLGAYNRWIPRSSSTATAIAPRPGVVSRVYARARADSTRKAKATELQRALNGNPGPQLVVNPPQPVPADTISGKLDAAGRIHGNLYDFDIVGRAAGEKVVARGNSIDSFKSEYAWTNARTPQAKISVALDAGGVSAMGFAFDTVNARVTYANPGGHIELAVTQGEKRHYGANGDYELNPDRKVLRLANMRFQFDTAYWSLTHPSTVQWGGPGIRVTDLELRNRSTGRIYADGLLPTDGVADFRIDVDNFPVSNIVDIAQTDIDADGILTVHGTMTGTLANPAFRGAYGVVHGMYNGSAVPDLRGTFGYADKLLVSHAEALRATGQPLAVVDARVPINLALSGVTGDRLLPEQLAVDVAADSLPIDLLPQFTDLVSNVHGRAVGRFAMRGTLRKPSLVGAFALTNASATLNSTGARFENINGAVRMANDTVFVDSLVAWAQGSVRARGTLAVGDWRAPAMNLFLVSDGAELFNNDRLAKIRVNAGLALSGPFDNAYLSGAVTVTQGVIYAPEPSGRHVVSAGDPALFNVLDTALVTEKDLFPPASPFLANMRVDVFLDINRNVWVRNREANVEIYTDDPLAIHEEGQALSITGVVATDRGEYSFLGKKFQIKRGSAMFIGGSDLNPTLQITGEYQVQVAARGALDIRVAIGGTLKKPTLALESDAQPPKTQSELLSLLAFGQSSTSLLASNSSSVAGSAATLDLFGVGAQAAVKRLASTALGVMVDQFQVQAGRAFGTDVFDITPADVPTDVTGNGFSNFIRDTKFEAGKYINPRTYVNASESAYRFGIGFDYRTIGGWRFSGAFEPRVLLLEPNLKDVNTATRRTLGGFIIREWRF